MIGYNEQLIVLIAGPFHMPSYWERLPWIRIAEKMMLQLYAHNFIPMCPQAQHQNIDDQLPIDKVDSAVLHVMRRCDAIMVLPGWQNDPSTLALLKIAHALMIPKFFKFENLVEWSK